MGIHTKDKCDVMCIYVCNDRNILDRNDVFRKKNPLIRFIPTFYCLYSIHRIKKPPRDLIKCQCKYLKNFFFLKFYTNYFRNMEFWNNEVINT